MTDRRARPGVSVEPARVDDLPSVVAMLRLLAELEGNSARFSATPELLEHAVSDPDHGMLCWVARAGPDVVGTAVCATSWTGVTCRPALRLVGLLVDGGWRRRGVGRLLMAAVAQRCAELGCGLDLVVRSENRGAHEFYAALGGMHRDGWEPWLVPSEDMLRLARRSG